MDNLVEEIRQKVLSMLDRSVEYSDEQIQDYIGEIVAKHAKKEHWTLSYRTKIEKQIFDSIRKLDILQTLIDDSRITEIMVNGPDHIFYEKDGEIHKLEKKFSSEQKLQDIIQQIVGQHNRVVNLSSPILDTRLEDGSRVAIVLHPVALDGSTISIRKFPEHPFTMQQLLVCGSITKEAADLLKRLVKSRFSIFISGGTSSGKTTFLNALSEYIPKNERIITIEDSAELQIQGIENLVRLETRTANMKGMEEITIRDLIRLALRMRPDRIIVGECRGEEAFDMLQAMNTGHDGSLSTGHANSCKDILSRIEMMVLMGEKDLPILAIRQQIAAGIQVLVQLRRLSDHSRRVVEITEVVGVRNGEIVLNPLFQLVNGKLEKVGELKNTERLHLYENGG